MSVVLPEPVWPISAIVRPAGDVEVDALEHRPARRRYSNETFSKRIAPGAWRELPRAGAVGDLLRLVDHLEDALAGRGRALRLPDPHAERRAAA